MAIKENDLVGFDRAGTLNNRGVLYFSEQRFAEAIKDFEDGRRVDPSIAELHVNHGAAMVALKRWAEGVASLSKGIELEPLEPEKAYYTAPSPRKSWARSVRPISTTSRPPNWHPCGNSPRCS